MALEISNIQGFVKRRFSDSLIEYQGDNDHILIQNNKWIRISSAHSYATEARLSEELRTGKRIDFDDLTTTTAATTPEEWVEGLYIPRATSQTAAKLAANLRWYSTGVQFLTNLPVDIPHVLISFRQDPTYTGDIDLSDLQVSVASPEKKLLYVEIVTAAVLDPVPLFVPKFDSGLQIWLPVNSTDYITAAYGPDSNVFAEPLLSEQKLIIDPDRITRVFPGITYSIVITAKTSNASVVGALNWMQNKTEDL